MVDCVLAPRWPIAQWAKGGLAVIERVATAPSLLRAVGQMYDGAEGKPRALLGGAKRGAPARSESPNQKAANSCRVELAA